MPSTRLAHDARIFQRRRWPPIPVVGIVIQKQDRAHRWCERDDSELPCTIRCADNQVLNRLLLGCGSRVGHGPDLSHRLVCQPCGWIERSHVIVSHREFSIIPGCAGTLLRQDRRDLPRHGEACEIENSPRRVVPHESRETFGTVKLLGLVQFLEKRFRVLPQIFSTALSDR